MTTITAHPSRSAVVDLLQRSGLPTADLTDERLEDFFFAGTGNAPFGVVGLELSPPHGLLRSLAVDDQARSGGLGSALLAYAEAYAHARGVNSLYLLTTTAERFFAARGYGRTARSEAPSSIRLSSEFTELCPASAIFMMKHLQE